MACESSLDSSFKFHLLIRNLIFFMIFFIIILLIARQILASAIFHKLGFWHREAGCKVFGRQKSDF